MKTNIKANYKKANDTISTLAKNGIFVQNLVGKKAFGIDGPGQWAKPGFCSSEGKIVDIEVSPWYVSYIVQWKDKTISKYPFQSVKPADSDNTSIGVYYA